MSSSLLTRLHQGTASFQGNIYDNFVKPHLRDHRSAWDNYANDAEFYESSEDHKDWNEIQHESWWSYDNCRKACAHDEGCMMFTYHRKEKKCLLSWCVKSGIHQALETPEDEKIESGWMMDRIENSSAVWGLVRSRTGSQPYLP